MKNIKFTRKKSIYLIISIIALLFILIYNYPTLVNTYAVPDDAPMMLYWMYQFQDSSLFQNDIITEFAVVYYGQPLFTMFYYAFSFFIEPLVAFKLIQIVLLLLFTIYFFKLGCALRDQKAGYTLALVFILFSPLLRNFYAYQRGFGLLFMVMFFYYFELKKYNFSSLLIFLQCLIYPSSCLVSLVVYGLSFIDVKNKLSINFKPKKKLILFMIISLLSVITLLILSVNQTSKLGEWFDYEEIKEMPEFYKGGRNQILPFPNIVSSMISNSFFYILPELRIHNFNFNFLWLNLIALRMGLLLTLALVLLFFLKKDLFNIPKNTYLILFSGIFLYFIAKLLALRLFIPDRYISSTFPFFVIIVLSLSISQCMNKFKSNSNLKKMFLILILIIFLTYVPSLIKYSHERSNGADCQNNIKLYNFISALDKNILIADHPENSDCTLLFSKRKIFISYELSYPFYKSYYSQIKERTYNFFDMYYSNSSNVVYDFCKDNGVDYIVVYEEYFSKEYFAKNKFYFNPFNDYVKSIINEDRGFILKEISNWDVVFSDEEVHVISCDSLN
jgi:hypothetical protein